MEEDKAPIISAIIPVYNREHTIGRAIRSVLAQTYPHFEIIVVDDGSTDGTRDVVKQFDDPRIRYLRHEQNKGAAAARNTGVRAARGEYIAFLDSDDEWLPEKLAMQLTVLENAPESVQATCTSYVSHFLDAGLVEEKILYRPPSWAAHFLLVGCDVSPGTTLMVRRGVFDRIGLLDEGLPRYEDWDWLIRYVRKYDLEVLAKPLAHVYVGPRPGGQTLEIATARFIAKHAAAMRAYGLYRQRQAIAGLWFAVAGGYFREKRLSLGLKWALRAVLQDPFRRPGLYLALLDDLLGTSLAVHALRWKRRFLERCVPFWTHSNTERGEKRSLRF